VRGAVFSPAIVSLTLSAGARLIGSLVEDREPTIESSDFDATAITMRALLAFRAEAETGRTSKSLW
jgi:hypothetical protein